MGEPLSLPHACAPPTAPTPSVPPSRRFEQVVRKALSTDPRMPIRLDRAAWKRSDPLSQDETEALVALGEAPPAVLAPHLAHTEPPPAPAAAATAPHPSAVAAVAAVAAAPLPVPALDGRPELMPMAATWRTRLLQTALRLPAPALAASMLMLLALMSLCAALDRQGQREQLRLQLRLIDASPQLTGSQRQSLVHDLASYQRLVGAGDGDLQRWTQRLRP